MYKENRYYKNGILKRLGASSQLNDSLFFWKGLWILVKQNGLPKRFSMCLELQLNVSVQ